MHLHLHDCCCRMFMGLSHKLIGNIYMSVRSKYQRVQLVGLQIQWLTLCKSTYIYIYKITTYMIYTIIYIENLMDIQWSPGTWESEPSTPREIFGAPLCFRAFLQPLATRLTFWGIGCLLTWHETIGAQGKYAIQWGAFEKRDCLSIKQCQYLFWLFF